MTGRDRCFRSTNSAGSSSRAKAGTHNYKCSLWSRLPKNIQRRVLQQDDRLGVEDAAVGDHGQRRIDRQFQYLDVLTLVREAAAAADPHIRLVFGDKEMLSFSDRTGTHKGFEYFLDLAEPIAGFLLR